MDYYSFMLKNQEKKLMGEFTSTILIYIMRKYIRVSVVKVARQQDHVNGHTDKSWMSLKLAI